MYAETDVGVLDLECLVRSDAFRTVLLAFKDGPVELGPAITGSLLSVANQPSTRRFLLQSSDVEVGVFIFAVLMSAQEIDEDIERIGGVDGRVWQDLLETTCETG